ncbi:uncharacterized protein LOC131683062 isoform X2 [Topomyia yanbarensis]|uniref:uncharacterized protein LOC131683062 isoform X2 n=1 Tax=Topomyia yanbarensis TaxID=2498891 RepID=UPI00273B803F|nr:uncharacterized protein LOC131683062 isoform X2 [Topomyia yanbarensis]
MNDRSNHDEQNAQNPPKCQAITEQMSYLELSWPEDAQHVIFRDQGSHYIRQGRYRAATIKLGEAVSVNPRAIDCHFRKSVAHFKNSDLKDSLISTRKGLAVERDESDPRGMDFPCSLQECRALFELDEFEEHVKVASNKKRHFVGHRLNDMEEEIRLGIRNYENILGEQAGPCLYRHRHRLRKIAAERELNRVDTRPGWKVKRDRGECDAVSVAELVIKHPHVREKKRQEKNLKMLGQIYLNRGWKDLLFLRSLQKDGAWEKVVNLPQAKESSKALSDTIEKCYKRVDAALVSLQSGTPHSTYRTNRFGSTEKADSHEMSNILKHRYTTYRDANNQLKYMLELRSRNQLRELLQYIGDTLWNYYQIKTVRVFPDRYKFVNEVCNLAGLAIVDSFQVPPTLMDEPLKDRLLLLFNLPLIREEEVVVPIFGDKSTYRDPAAPDYGYIAYKNRITILEKRIPYSSYAIERAFLYHEMCRHHLAASKLDETRIIARRVIDEATESGSNLWKFLGILALVRADCIQMNLEKLTESLEETKEPLLALADERLDHVIQVAKVVSIDQ